MITLAHHARRVFLRGGCAFVRGQAYGVSKICVGEVHEELRGFALTCADALDGARDVLTQAIGFQLFHLEE